MKYPLPERIGRPELLVGRKKEFAEFNQWIEGIPENISKSRAILARKKSGKTAFIQRIFNELWLKNGNVIPFFMEIKEQNLWYPLFAIKYYQTFASQYISFLERDLSLVREPLSLEEIREYGKQKSIRSFVRDVEELLKHREQGSHDLWTWNLKKFWNDSMPWLMPI